MTFESLNCARARAHAPHRNSTHSTGWTSTHSTGVLPEGIGAGNIYDVNGNAQPMSVIRGGRPYVRLSPKDREVVEAAIRVHGYELAPFSQPHAKAPRRAPRLPRFLDSFRRACSLSTHSSIDIERPSPAFKASKFLDDHAATAEADILKVSWHSTSTGSTDADTSNDALERCGSGERRREGGREAAGEGVAHRRGTADTELYTIRLC